MRTPLAAAAALLLTAAGSASAQTLTFSDLPDWNYAYDHNGASSTVTSGGFNLTASPYSYNNYYYSSGQYSFVYTYPENYASYYGFTSPSKMIYTVSPEVTLTKADNGRFSFQGGQLATWDSYLSGFTVEGHRDGAVVNSTNVAVNGSSQAQTFATAWSDLDSVTIKPDSNYSYNDYYYYDYQYVGNYILLSNLQVNSATPEASTWVLMALGALSMMAFAAHRRQAGFSV